MIDWLFRHCSGYEGNLLGAAVAGGFAVLLYLLLVVMVGAVLMLIGYGIVLSAERIL